MDLVVAGTENAVLMVESEARVLSEAQMLGAVMFGHEQSQAVIAAVKEFGEEAGKEKWDWQPVERDESIVDSVTAQVGSQIEDAYQISNKADRQEALANVRNATILAVCGEEDESGTAGVVADEIKRLEKQVVRGQVIAGKPRIDGRDTKTVRPINIEDQRVAPYSRVSKLHKGRNSGDRGRNSGD